MRAVGCLVLRGGVPPWIGVHHHGRAHEVQARVAGFERDEEYGHVVAVEFVDQFHTAFLRRLAGDGVVFHALFGESGADEFEERGELREHEDLFAFAHACGHEFGDGVEFGGGVLRVGVYESWIAADFAQQGEFGEDADLLGVEVGVRRLGERGA